MTKLKRENTKLISILHKFSNGIVQERKRTFKVDATNVTSYTTKKRLAMLDSLLTAQYNGADINDESIREEVDTFMFEGHDTTSMAICYALMALANEESVQQRILEELHDIFGESDRNPTYNDLMEMKYMERCIKEALRLYPSVPFIARLAGEDIKTSTGYTIPKGSYINIHIYDLHRNPPNMGKSG
ncbi:hypothetical protein NQ318_003696 [Aromia moschata]|uniref:Cytochrome P450 n=1 Tax=Aromia moschata TaxID=1265417 RepID=A0AAV8YIL1_9CUCU|nr:hypothetical protein NQ318_003696 [Aromia moschata]